MSSVEDMTRKVKQNTNQPGAGEGMRPLDVLLGKQAHVTKLLNKLSVSQRAELSKARNGGYPSENAQHKAQIKVKKQPF